MNLNDFNKLDKQSAADQLKTCCGSSKWVEETMKNFPFKDETKLIAASEEAWYVHCGATDWMEAFSHHPKIGDRKSLTEKFASTQHFAGKEQAGVDSASMDIIDKLAKANQEYERLNGFIFIVCATGKSAGEMLELLNHRLANSKQEEILIAKNEQHKITVIRLQKMLPDADWSVLKSSQLTTHVLDTSVGRPGKNITVRLKRLVAAQWLTFAQGITNEDGRVPGLLPPNRTLNGNYKICFDTAAYFVAQNQRGFYPEVEIQFSMNDASHYHVPLLLNPYGYSTYRGS